MVLPDFVEISQYKPQRFFATSQAIAPAVFPSVRRGAWYLYLLPQNHRRKVPWFQSIHPLYSYEDPEREAGSTEVVRIASIDASILANQQQVTKAK